MIMSCRFLIVSISPTIESISRKKAYSVRVSGSWYPALEVHTLFHTEDLSNPIGDLLGLRQDESLQVPRCNGQIGRTASFLAHKAMIKTAFSCRSIDIPNVSPQAF